MTQPLFSLTLYGRPGCHLCEEVERRIKRVGQDFPLVLRTVNIQEDIRLEEKYMLTIPVVEIDGDEAFVSITGIMSEDELRRELERRIRLA